MSKYKKFRSLKEVYMTGQTYKREESKPVQHRRLTEMYSEVYKPEKALLREGWGKLTKPTLDPQTRSDKIDRLKAFVYKIENGETFEDMEGSTVGPFDVETDWLEDLKASINSDKPTMHTTYIPLKGGERVLLKNLAKTAEFGGVASGTTRDTDVKEGLVSLFFINGGLGVDGEKVIAENYYIIVESLLSKLTEIRNGQAVLYETEKSIDSLYQFLERELANRDAGVKPKAGDLHFLNQPLSQAVTLRLGYADWMPTRFKFFEKIRRVATQTTGFRPDKWNPGDIYLIDPKQEQYIDEVLSSMNPSDVVENLKTINNLFVTEWGDRSQPIVSVSLKYANAQHGKAKDFLKSRLRGPAVGETQGPWLTTGEEQQWDAATLINASNQLRQNITQAINSKGTDVDILYQAQTQPELQAGQQVPEKEMRRVQMKYSALKILDFMFSTADTDQLDDIIVGAIGYAMSLAGVNPVFFKIEANKDGAPIEEPFKFSAGGAVALYPHQGQTNPTINISDLTSNAALIITCNIEVGEDIKAAQLEIKPSGRSQATIELTKAKTIDLSM